LKKNQQNQKKMNFEINNKYFEDEKFPITLNTTFNKWYLKKLSSAQQQNFILIETLDFIEGRCELKYYKECKSLQIYSFELKKPFQNQNIITNFCKNILQSKNYEIDYIVIFDVHYNEVKKFLKFGWSTKCYKKETHKNIYQNIFMENENYAFKDSLHKCNCNENEIFLSSSSFYEKENEDEEMELLKLQEKEIYNMYLFFFCFFTFVCLIGQMFQK